MTNSPDRRVPFNDLSRSLATRAGVHSAVESVLDTGWYVLGPQCAAFERELAEFLGVKHVLGVASGTDAISLALQAVGCMPGDLVATVANAGGYTSTAAKQVGCMPVLVDVDPQSLLMSPDSLTDAIAALPIKAVVLTHLYGNTVAPELTAICRAAGVAVVEDCAQAIGAMVDGHRAGSLGDASAFSFYPTKNLGGVGDGGAVASNSALVIDTVRQLRQYGWSDKYLVDRPGGRNSRLDEIQAAVLRHGLRLVDSGNTRRREIIAAYDRALKGGKFELVTRQDESSAAHLAVVRAPDQSSRDAFRKHCDTWGVSTAIHYPIPDDQQPGLSVQIVSSLSNSTLACRTILSLPTFPELTDAEVSIVCDAISAFH